MTYSFVKLFHANDAFNKVLVDVWFLEITKTTFTDHIKKYFREYFFIKHGKDPHRWNVIPTETTFGEPKNEYGILFNPHLLYVKWLLLTTKQLMEHDDVVYVNRNGGIYPVDKDLVVHTRRETQELNWALTKKYRHLTISKFPNAKHYYITHYAEMVCEKKNTYKDAREYAESIVEPDGKIYDEC